jgi:hypothetical protein
MASADRYKKALGNMTQGFIHEPFQKVFLFEIYSQIDFNFILL